MPQLSSCALCPEIQKFYEGFSYLALIFKYVGQDMTKRYNKILKANSKYKS